ncbi:DUF1033 family protein [Planococcus shenhongbingii]|uniref:DUF1033 family protein n=1 Tax=Planococcus shenhongbingii TaxID=3058398 RepID=A0ABT8N8F6_9BACL|nr:DUF1033 family protein [Planococcus sp. N017]MDN7243937.1 DUF1033 family protein [Planococcus sp. N017]
MHEIFYLRGFEEPWWQFDGWEKDIVSCKEFDNYEDALIYFNQMKQTLTQDFSFQKSKGEAAIAFWNREEWAFCEDCEEDMQIYHGLLWIYNKKPIESF